MSRCPEENWSSRLSAGESSRHKKVSRGLEMKLWDRVPFRNGSAARSRSQRGRATTSCRQFQTTFGKSGHRAPHISFKFFACLRGRSAVISSDQPKDLGVDPPSKHTLRACWHIGLAVRGRPASENLLISGGGRPLCLCPLFRLERAQVKGGNRARGYAERRRGLPRYRDLKAAGGMMSLPQVGGSRGLAARGWSGGARHGDL